MHQIWSSVSIFPLKNVPSSEGLGLERVGFDPDQIRECETFVGVESALQAAVEGWALEHSRWTPEQHHDLRTLIKRRLQGFWASWPERYEEIKPRWRLVQAAVEVINAAGNVEEGLKLPIVSPAEILERYAGDLSDEKPWCDLDTYQRQLERRNLERQPSRYKKVASRVSELVGRLGVREIVLVLDITATGRPVYALIWEQLSDVLEESRTYATVCPITVSGIAGGVSRSPDVGYLVPRRDLISTTQILFDVGALKIAEGLALSDTLRDELLTFKPKVTQKPDDLEGWREGKDDDLVLAVATSVWAAERFLYKEESKPVDLIRNTG